MPTSWEAISDQVEGVGEEYDAEANLERLTDTAPAKLVQGAADTFRAGFQIGSDIVNADFEALSADTAEAAATALGFVDEAANTIGSIVSDPLGWLISNGVSFLISWIEPLNDMLDLVTGDPDALQSGADTFNKLGTEIEKLREETEQLLAEGLSDWDGPAAAAAGKRLAEFRDGVSGTAGATGEIATLLAVSSAVMSVIKDVITSIISDLVEWLIVTWLAALAASTFTFGGSVVAAEGTTAVEAGMATSKAGRWVQRVQAIIQKLKGLVDKIKAFIGRIPQKLVDGTLTENLGESAAKALAGGGKQARHTIGGLIGQQVGDKVKEATVDALKDTVYEGETTGAPNIVGTIEKNAETVEGFADALERRNTAGDPDMSDAEISGKLDF
ncbi:hypothetical protein [Amycolatopsis thermophila]|uniref:Uncharacterized protein n=1 Tax=Amycolatopsis thermophila TaxID=206084 RepID=A0ABU0EQJ9_9PSEU|nr:hypothetical protein [Amycolatopsis thermophila]MDQ0377563.1 hypothetical protein [Amycolatopsis thermophila]